MNAGGLLRDGDMNISPFFMKQQEHKVKTAPRLEGTVANTTLTFFRCLLMGCIQKLERI